MIDARLATLGALALNALWGVVLPTLSGKAVAGLGVLTALLLAARISGRSVNPFSVALFLLPAISLLWTFHLVFWRLDGRAWLIVAWLVYAIALAAKSTEPSDAHASRPPVETSVGVFFLWTSVFWLTVVFDLGISGIIARVDRAVTGPCRVDWLTTMSSIWERFPASQHLFLAWRSNSSFADRVVYENHVHPYLFAMYAWIVAVRRVSGVATYVASNSTAVLLMAVIVGALWVLLARTGQLGRSRGGAGFLTLFVALGFVITAWRFWNDLLLFNTDNPYPLLAALFCMIYAFLLAPANPRLSVVASVVFVALSPIHLPMLLLAVVCLFGTPGTTFRDFIDRNRSVLRLGVMSTIVAFFVMAVPWTLVAWKGYTGQSSTFLYRSGLDGDTSYLRNILQAAWSACPGNCCGTPRSIVTLLLPAFLPLCVFAWQMCPDESSRLGGLGRLMLFLATPYLMSLVFFAQAVAVHPYLYDHLLIVPAVLAGAAMMTTDSVKSRLHGPGLLGFLIFAAFLIMSNLIGIAQGVRAMR